MDELSGDLELLRELSADELERVRAITAYRSFGPGEVILKQGAPVDSVFVILTGLVRVTAILADGEGEAGAGADEEVLARLGSGELFGEVSFVTEAPPNLSVVAEEPVRLGVIPHAGLHQLIEHDASLCRKLLFAIMRILVARLRSTGRELVLTRYFIRGN